MNRELFSAGLLVVLCACSSTAGRGEEPGIRGTGVADTARDTSDTGIGESDFARVRLSGGLELVDGQVGGGTVIYTLYQASGAEIFCTQEHAISDAVELESTEPDWVCIPKRREAPFCLASCSTLFRFAARHPPPTSRWAQAVWPLRFHRRTVRYVPGANRVT